MKLLDILNESPSFYTGPSEEKKTKMVKKVKNVYEALKSGMVKIPVGHDRDDDHWKEKTKKFKYVLNNNYQLGIGTELTIVFVKMEPIKFQVYEIINGNEWHVDKNQGLNLFIYEKVWKEISDKFQKFDLILR
jgi:hypothetical protein